MKVWQRHSLFATPFVIAYVAVRRAAEAGRLVYWRHVFGWDIGRGVRVHWSVHIPKKIRVTLGDGVEIASHVQIWSEVAGAELTLGHGVVLARAAMLDASGGLRIGDNTTVSEEAQVYTHSHGRNPRNAPAYHPLTIGAHCWLCTRALVLASARTVGDGAVIGPYEVVRAPVAAGALHVTQGDVPRRAGP